MPRMEWCPPSPASCLATHAVPAAKASLAGGRAVPTLAIHTHAPLLPLARNASASAPGAARPRSCQGPCARPLAACQLLEQGPAWARRRPAAGSSQVGARRNDWCSSQVPQGALPRRPSAALALPKHMARPPGLDSLPNGDTARAGARRWRAAHRLACSAPLCALCRWRMRPPAWQRPRWTRCTARGSSWRRRRTAWSRWGLHIHRGGRPCMRTCAAFRRSHLRRSHQANTLPHPLALPTLLNPADR